MKNTPSTTLGMLTVWSLLTWPLQGSGADRIDLRPSQPALSCAAGMDSSDLSSCTVAFKVAREVPELLDRKGLLTVPVQCLVKLALKEQGALSGRSGIETSHTAQESAYAAVRAGRIEGTVVMKLALPAETYAARVASWACSASLP